MKFICNPCNYETDDQSNLNRHKKSRKHLDNCHKPAIKLIAVTPESSQVIPKNGFENVISKKRKNECGGCGATFAFKQGLSKHRKNCKVEVASNDKKIIAELQAKIKDLEISNLKSKVDYLEKNVKTLSIVAENATETSKTSCSALNFVMKHYKNAPCIQEFDDYQLLLEGNEDYSIADVVLHKYEKNELVSFIGDVLIKKYKTANPGQQTMWSSDTARLAYIIRELTADNEPEWSHDKGGVKTAKYTVKPIIKHIKEDLTRLINESRDALFNTDRDDLINDNSAQLRKKILDATEILQYTAKSEFVKEVIRYMASHFFLDRKLDQKQLTYENEDIIEEDL
jgi:hypothetical protein